MATKKKLTTAKTSVKKKPTTARKATVNKKAAKRSVLTKHIGLQPEETEFMTFRITRQTLYWIVLGVVVIMFTLWLTQLQADIQDLYNQIDATTAESNTL